MAQLNINKEMAVSKIQKELQHTEENAINTLNKLNEVSPELYPIVEAWYRGELVDYEFQGLSIFTIMEKHQFHYLGAILLIDRAIKNPDRIDYFKTVTLKRK